MSKSGIEELTESLKKACGKHPLFDNVPGEVIQKVIDTLIQEQFSDDRKIALKSLNALLNSVVDDLI